MCGLTAGKKDMRRCFSLENLVCCFRFFSFLYETVSVLFLFCHPFQFFFFVWFQTPSYYYCCWWHYITVIFPSATHTPDDSIRQYGIRIIWTLWTESVYTLRWVGGGQTIKGFLLRVQRNSQNIFVKWSSFFFHCFSWNESFSVDFFFVLFILFGKFSVTITRWREFNSSLVVWVFNSF